MAEINALICEPSGAMRSLWALNTGLPFALVLLLLCVGLGIALQEESSPGDSP